MTFPAPALALDATRHAGAKWRDVIMRSGRSHAAVGLFILAAFFTLYIARGFFLPVTIAVVLALVLRPFVTALQRLHVPAGVSAAGLLLLVVGLGGYGLTSLYAPAMHWVSEAPTALRRVESKLRELRRPVDEVGRAAAQVERITDPAANGPTVALKQPGLGLRLLTGTVDAVTAVTVTAFMLFFLLATGGRLLTKIVAFVSETTRAQTSAAIVAETERQVSRYLVTITLINIALGLVVGLALWAIGLPNPVLWGVVVTILNFVPYIGGIVGTIVVCLAGLLAFDDVGRALTASGVYIVLNGLEGMLITPMILGRRFAVDPCVVFVWLVFWTWLWGVAGALLAMPMLTIVKIISERIDTLRPLAELIGESETRASARLAERLAARRKRRSSEVKPGPAPATAP